LNVILYSTGCPKCNILKKKLADAKIDYKVIEDVDVMLSKGLKEVPWLEVDGNLMNFVDSSKWINERV
jgi:glutaredoxin-related protein